MKRKRLLLFLIILLSSCDKLELNRIFPSYENVNFRFDQSIQWNEQYGHSEINIPENTYRLHIMGDSHVGDMHEEDSPMRRTENLDTFFKEAQDKKITAAVMVGDLLSGHKDDYDVFAEHLPSKDSLTSFAIVGNHDLLYDGWQYYYEMFGSSTYFFVINTPRGNDLFICLDTGAGTLGNKQLDWFKTLLETSRKNYRYCTVFTHNNLFHLKPNTNMNPMVEEIHVLMDLFLRHKVNMVVTAHDHVRDTYVLGKTTHIILDALKDENDEASYLELTIKERKIDYRFIEL